VSTQEGKVSISDTLRGVKYQFLNIGLKVQIDR
jgi:hypothetical protein